MIYLVSQGTAEKQDAYGPGRACFVSPPDLHLLHDWYGGQSWQLAVYVHSCVGALHSSVSVLLDDDGSCGHLPRSAQEHVFTLHGYPSQTSRNLLLE